MGDSGAKLESADRPEAALSLKESFQITCSVDGAEYKDHPTIKPVEQNMLWEAGYGGAS